MLSIIISSVCPDQLTLIKSNIESTVGIPYEVIVIDNKQAQMGLCEAYNIGARKARFDFLCFMHEDINLKTHQWGKKVINYFNDDEKLGLIGVAGASYKSSVFSGWVPFGDTPKTIDYGNIIQSFKYQDKPSAHFYSNPNDLIIQEVAVLDGVWLCTKKEIMEKCPFDESIFKGFHCYDIDISLNIGRKHKVAVVMDILIDHYSEGKFEKEWAEATFALQQKWKKHLPVDKENFSRKEIAHYEKKFFRTAVIELMTLKFSLKEILTVLKCSNIKSINLFLYIKLYITSIYKFNKTP